MSVYNYMNFPLDGDMRDFVAFPEGPRVGGKAPDGELVDVRDGRRVRLSEYFPFNDADGGEFLDTVSYPSGLIECLLWVRSGR